jgi:hypothetical protein
MPTGNYPAPDSTEGRVALLEERLDKYRREQKDSQATVNEHGDRLDAVEELVGRLPSALPGDKGSGLAQHFVDLRAAVDNLSVVFNRKVDTLTAAIDADREARTKEAEARTKELAELQKKRDPYWRALWIIVGVALSFITLGVLNAIKDHLHWSRASGGAQDVLCDVAREADDLRRARALPRGVRAIQLRRARQA